MDRKIIVTKFQRRLELALSLSGMTAREVAKKAGMSEANISQYRAGRSLPRDTERLLMLANALGVDPSWLLGYDGPIQPSDQDGVDLFLSLSPENKLRALDFMKYLKTKEARDVQG